VIGWTTSAPQWKPRQTLNRIGFRLYAAFCPDVPEGIEGSGAKGELSIDGFTSAVERISERKLVKAVVQHEVPESVTCMASPTPCGFYSE
jgi:hypothetical protein